VKLNTSGSSTISSSNAVERKNSTEEKRSVTYSNKANSTGSTQQLNESSKSFSSAEVSLHNSAIDELGEEEEILAMEDDDGGRCRIM
jgi:hypothetical protein